MRWSDLESAQPGLARLGQERLLRPGVVLVGTIRRDGSPRLSPVEPYVLDGDLWLCLLWRSAKAADLLRDPRVLVHSIVTGRDGAEGEFKVRGTARAEHDPAVQRRYSDAVTAELGWSPTPGRSRDQPARPRAGARHHRGLAPEAGENGPATVPPAAPALSAAERQAAQALLAEAWGERAEIRAADARSRTAATCSGCTPGLAARPCSSAGTARMAAASGPSWPRWPT